MNGDGASVRLVELSLEKISLATRTCALSLEREPVALGSAYRGSVKSSAVIDAAGAGGAAACGSACAMWSVICTKVRMANAWKVIMYNANIEKSTTM